MNGEQRQRKMQRITWIGTALTVLIVVIMTAAAEWLKQPEIIFPEVAAVGTGLLAAPKIPWKTTLPKVVLLISISAVAGFLISVGIDAPLWIKMMTGYALVQLIFLYSGTTFAPIISATVLPVLMHTDSVVYPVSAVLLTLLTACTAALFYRLKRHQTGEATELAAGVPFPDARERRTFFCRMAVAGVFMAFVLPWNVLYATAPPLLVALTEWTRPGSPGRRHPVKAVLLIFGAGISGCLCRMLFSVGLSLPLTVSAGAAILLLLLLMKSMTMYLPPAAALAILPMRIPQEALLTYPLQILLGAAVYMAAALILFRCFPEKRSPDHHSAVGRKQ